MDGSTLYTLTEREQQILQFIYSKYEAGEPLPTSSDISAALHLNIQTVRNYLARLKERRRLVYVHGNKPGYALPDYCPHCKRAYERSR